MLSVKLGNCGEPRESVRREGKEGGEQEENKLWRRSLAWWLENKEEQANYRNREREREREKERETKLAEVQKLSTLLQQKKYAGEKNPISSPDLQHNEHQFCGLNLLCPSHKKLEHHL